MTLGLSPSTSYSKQPGLPSFIFHLSIHGFASMDHEPDQGFKACSRVQNEEQENTTLQSLKIQIFTTVPWLNTHRMAVESFYEAGGGGEEGGSGDASESNKKVRDSSTLRAQLLTSRAAAAKPGTPPRSTPPLALAFLAWVAAYRRLTREPTHRTANAALDLSSKTNRELVQLLRHRVRSVLSDECGLRLRLALTRPPLRAFARTKG